MLTLWYVISCLLETYDELLRINILIIMARRDAPSVQKILRTAERSVHRSMSQMFGPSIAVFYTDE